MARKAKQSVRLAPCVLCTSDCTRPVPNMALGVPHRWARRPDGSADAGYSQKVWCTRCSRTGIIHARLSVKDKKYWGILVPA